MNIKISNFLGAIFICLIAFLALFTSKTFAAVNLIPNPSVETASGSAPLSWNRDNWGANTPLFTYLQSGQDGKRSVHIQMKSYTSGDAKWYSNSILVKPNVEYFYSDYYKSSVKTPIVVEIEDTAGNLSYVEIGVAPVASFWKKVGFAFITPANASKVKIYHIINAVGYLQTDNFSLIELRIVPPSPTPAPVTITDNVPNNSVEQVGTVDATKPEGWASDGWGTNTALFTYLANDGSDGTHSVRTEITSYTSGDAKWHYKPQPVTPNTKWRFTDHYKSNVVSRVVVEVNLQNNTQTYIELKNAPASASWITYTDFFTTPANAVSMSVFHLISAVGYLVTDDYHVTAYTPLGFNRPIVSITFDDGWDSQYFMGLPQLQANDFKATFYITTGFLNTQYYMTDHMIEMLRDGGNEIAAHTVTHRHLPTLTDAELDAELKNSQDYLKSHFNVAADNFASPFGDVDARVLDKVKTYYKSHRGVLADYNNKDNFDKYNIKVQNVISSTTKEEVQGWVNEAKNNKEWLILVYHQIAVTPDIYSAVPQSFTDQMNIVKQSGVAVVTVDQGLSEVSSQ